MDSHDFFLTRETEKNASLGETSFLKKIQKL